MSQMREDQELELAAIKHSLTKGGTDAEDVVRRIVKDYQNDKRNALKNATDEQVSVAYADGEPGAAEELNRRPAMVDKLKPYRQSGSL